MKELVHETKNLKRRKRTIFVLHVLIWTVVLLFLSWTSMKPPMFEGVAGAIGICYFITLLGVLATSFYWLMQAETEQASETISRGTRTFVIASLVVSILVLVGSLFFVLFALAIRGLFNMI